MGSACTKFCCSYVLMFPVAIAFPLRLLKRAHYETFDSSCIVGEAHLLLYKFLAFSLFANLLHAL